MRLESPNQSLIRIHSEINELCRLNRLQNQPQTTGNVRQRCERADLKIWDVRVFLKIIYSPLQFQSWSINRSREKEKGSISTFDSPLISVHDFSNILWIERREERFLEWAFEVRPFIKLIGSHNFDFCGRPKAWAKLVLAQGRLGGLETMVGDDGEKGRIYPWASGVIWPH